MLSNFPLPYTKTYKQSQRGFSLLIWFWFYPDLNVTIGTVPVPYNYKKTKKAPKMKLRNFIFLVDWVFFSVEGGLIPWKGDPESRDPDPASGFGICSPSKTFSHYLSAFVTAFSCSRSNCSRSSSAEKASVEYGLFYYLKAVGGGDNYSKTLTYT